MSIVVQDRSCPELAYELSRNYWNSTPFVNNATNSGGGDGIKSYLLSHGVLLTMCFPSACSVDPSQTNHIAASWIHSVIGPQLISTISNIGLILDPSKADLQCIYPTDGATNARDDNGCGPLKFDPKFGSNGAAALNPLTRWITRRTINSYKEFNYGEHTAWEDIDCEDALGMGHFFSYPADPWVSPHYPEQIFWSWGGNEAIHDPFEIVYERDVTLVKQSYDAIMGHPVCTVVDPEPNFDRGFFIYSGKQGMPPQQWEDAIQTQQEFLATFPERRIWNEVVLGLPSHMPDLVRAVFYLDSPDMSWESKVEIRKQAKRNAGLLQKPLLKLDMARASSSTDDDEDVFVCDKKAMFPMFNTQTN